MSTGSRATAIGAVVGIALVLGIAALVHSLQPTPTERIARANAAPPSATPPPLPRAKPGMLSSGNALRPSPGKRPADAVRAQGIEVPPPPAEPTPSDTDDGEELHPSSTWPPDAEGFRSAVAERLGDLHDCYETYLQTDPELAGNLKIRFVLETEGDVAMPRGVQIADSDLQHTILEGCIATIFEELRFEPEGDQMAVTWPLKLVADP